MRILHIYKDYYPVLGGMENHIKMLAEEQCKRGHQVTVLVTHPTHRTHIEEINGVRVIKSGRLATIASTPVSIILPLLLSKERPNIAHLHFPYPLGEMSQLLFGKASHVVLTYHSDVVRQKIFLRLYNPFLKLILRKVDRIIATSANYIESSPYLKQFKEKCTIIPLGIDLTSFLNSDQQEVQKIRNTYGSPLLLFVGKLRYYKGLQYLIEAMERIPATLLVAGSGPMETYWHQIARSQNLLK
jgi:rhamnosyl/mannosyltransferase